jgi:hypothetical protein
VQLKASGGWYSNRNGSGNGSDVVYRFSTSKAYGFSLRCGQD